MEVIFGIGYLWVLVYEYEITNGSATSHRVIKTQSEAALSTKVPPPGELDNT